MKLDALTTKSVRGTIGERLKRKSAKQAILLILDLKSHRTRNAPDYLSSTKQQHSQSKAQESY